MVEFVFKIILGCSFLSIGIYILCKFLYFIIKSKQSLKWKTTKGIVLESYNKKIPISDTLDFEYKIVYKFNINKIEYIGRKLFFRIFVGDDKNYEKKYQVGKEVSVHYNPRKPKDCILEPGTAYNLYYLIPISILFITIGALILIK